jgi:glycosyltransferase involved in cell wall biosynthesis
VKEAISSALAQTVPFDEIVVIDDASSDESPRIINELVKDRSNMIFIRHDRNMGQLAAFETGIIKSNGDLIFFLDADDVYAPNYLETSLSVYNHSKDCDFLSCCKVDFGPQLPPNLFEIKPRAEMEVVVTDLGFSLVRTFEDKVWIGAPTSCLSIRRSLANKLFPLPVHEDWRLRADDCIVFGASLAGCRKFRLECALVGYRLHGNNAWANNKRLADLNVVFLREVSIVRLVNLFSERFYIGQNISNIAEIEFKTLPCPSFYDLCRYARYVRRSRAKPTSRTRAIGVLVKWYLRSRSWFME